jgi:hypothetical protein
MSYEIHKSVKMKMAAAVVYREHVNDVVHIISTKAMHVSKNTPKARFEFPLNSLSQFYLDFCNANLDVILAKLQKKFPDTRVSHSLLTRAPDGKLYDVDTLGEEHFANTMNTKSYIVLDWSGLY